MPCQHPTPLTDALKYDTGGGEGGREGPEYDCSLWILCYHVQDGLQLLKEMRQHMPCVKCNSALLYSVETDLRSLQCTALQVLSPTCVLSLPS